MATAMSRVPEPDASEDPLDSYSATVIRVAAAVTPHVAALEVGGTGRRGRFLTGAGSAVLFTSDGYLLTNAHVVAGAQRGSAVYSDGTRTEVDVVGSDPLSDLAVVHGKAPTAAPAALGDAESLRVGQLVIAVGNPLGLSGSVTAGVVSGLGRALPVRTRTATRIVEDVIQTDAALNPGSSGGALADSQGRVVGINTAVAGMGLGLAVPINATSRRIIYALMHDGRVRRGYLGLVTSPAPLPPEWAARTGQHTALRVVEVVAASPASFSGLHPGDLILAVGGDPLGDAQSLQRLLFEESIGTRLEITVLRNGALVDAVAVPSELSD